MMRTSDKDVAVVIPLEAELPPIRRDDHGDYRVGNTRVLLELVIHQFQVGSTPNDIVRMYTTLDLADVYGVISFYLKHRSEVDAHLDWRERKAVRVKARIDAIQGDLSDLRDRINARRKLLVASYASVAE